MKRIAVLAASHVAVLAVGFAAGVYVLPILTAPPSPAATDVALAMRGAAYVGQFRRDLRGSDFLHWGEGRLAVGPRSIALEGRLAPGPDYKLYLVAGFVETREAFLQIKPQAVRVGDVKTFDSFLVPVPDTIDVDRYDTVVIWCETFAQFITAAKYR